VKVVYPLLYNSNKSTNIQKGIMKEVKKSEKDDEKNDTVLSLIFNALLFIEKKK